MIKLNLGCGDSKLEGFLGVDIRDLPSADVCHDLLNPLPWNDNEVDEILASDVLEHFSMADTDVLLKDWYRVLKPGGKIHVRVPHLRLIATRMVHKFFPDDDLITLIYGGQEYPENFHKSGFTENTLTRDLKNIGFSKIEKVFPSDNNLNVIAIK